MRRSLVLGVVAVALLHSGTSSAARPKWVRAFDGALSKQAKTEGIQWHLSDTQIRHTGAEVETYRRVAVSFHDRESTTEWDSLWFGTNAEILFVRLFRSDEQLRVPAPVLNQERGFWIVELPELAPGDLLDYAFVERTPREAITGTIDLFEGGDTDRRRVRLLVPAEAGVKVEILGKGETPEPKPIGRFVEYAWEAEELPAVHYAADAPGWYFQSPWLHYSNVESWASLGQQLGQRFDTAREPTDEVRKVAAELVAVDSASEPERAIAAALYVQQSIKTLARGGVDAELHPLADVLKSNSGTSVEKALLLALLARAMGLEAYVGLAHRGYRGSIDEHLPGIEMLDVALTGVRVDGDLVWIDPTGSDSPEAGLVPPPWKSVLSIAPTSTGLLEIPTRELSAPTVDALDAYELDGDGALFTITVEYRGADAEAMRSTLAASSPEELTEAFAGYVKEFHSDIEVLAPAEFRDDPKSNRFTTVERYRVPSFWNGHRRLVPVEVIRVVPVPEENRPRAPLAVEHPRYVRHRIRVELPPELTIEHESDQTKTAAFFLDYSQHVDDGVLEVEWGYRSRASYVPAKYVNRYSRRLDEIPSEFLLSYVPLEPGAPYWHRFGVILGVFVVAAGTLQLLERRRVLRNATARVMRRG